jgi:hypothetical protein
MVNGIAMAAGDGAGVRGERPLTLQEGRGAEVLVWDLP